jgi:hypothetical protein
MYLCTFLYFQLKVCMWFLAGMTSIQMIAALSFKPLMPSRDESEPKKDCLHQLINVDNWKNTKYVIWALAIPSALFGYFVPYVHIVSCFQIFMSCPSTFRSKIVLGRFKLFGTQNNWKNTKYVIWALFGYFVSYVHIVSHF